MDQVQLIQSLRLWRCISLCVMPRPLALCKINMWDKQTKHWIHIMSRDPYIYPKPYKNGENLR